MLKVGSLLAMGLGVLATVGLAVAPAHGAKKAKGGKILDTHVHTWKVTRPGGVPWPGPKQKVIYRDVSPEDYQTVAKPLGVIGTGIVEASNLQKDNMTVLELIKGKPFFPFFVANIEVASAGFDAQLAELSKDPKVVGVRAFLQAPVLGPDAKQIADCKKIADKGMTMDIISRGTKNPKDKVGALAEAVPNLRIIIDHLGGAKGKTVDPAWEASIKKLAEHKNVYMKFSSFFDMFNPTSEEDEPWESPKDVAAYKPHFDVIFAAFGPDRIIFGSNWPVVDLGGGPNGLADEIKIAEEYLKPLGTATRDKVMYKNAQAFYKRNVPK
jgi:L-fuconolactonase